ncbi:MAG: hypothetical protein JWM99_172 [Verrucomicrobiales bacterium]|nr:hypothetical protein [Verrucomicrobiales bacterium]
MKSWPLILAMLLAISRVAEAHRLDDLLQAAFIEITPTEIRLQLNLNPGVEVSDKLIWMIDRDGDRTISAAEEKIFSECLKQRLSVSVDNHPLALEVLSAEFDPPSELRSGSGNIKVEMRGRLSHPLAGMLRLRFENRNWSEMSAYLVNAVLPRNPTIRILKQVRNDNQSLGWIDFSVEPSKSEGWTRTAPLIATALLAMSGLLFICRKQRVDSIRRGNQIDGGGVASVK